MDTCKQPNAGEVVSGLEQVVLDDNIHPFVANIKMAESHMKLFTVEIKHKNKKQNIIISDRRTISFSKIVSIQQIKNTCKKYRKEDMKTLKFELSDAHFTRIFLRERKMEEVKGQSSGPDAASDVTSCLDLITCGFSRLHVQLVSLWHAQRLRASLCIDDQYGHTAVDLAEDYYRETVTSLREVGKQKSPLADQVEILHEFADEVVSDIELKTICFQDKELFIMLFKLYDSVLAAPDHKMVHMKNKALMMTNLSTKNKTDVEIEETIFKRLLLFHAIIRAMHAILVSSQSIETRFDVFSWEGGRPLDLTSWADLLLGDVHEELCHMLGYKFGNLNDAEVNREINKSFENVSIFTPRRKKSHDYGEGLGQESAFFSTNKITNIFSDELLTPLRERVQKQFALFGVDHRSKLPVLVRSIKDMQTMLTFCCVDACVTGRQAYQKNGDVVYPPPSLRMVDNMIRHRGWESVVEDVMIRISNILDDMLVLDSVVCVIKKRFWQVGQTPRVPTARGMLSSCHDGVSGGVAHPQSTPPPSNRESDGGHAAKYFTFDQAGLVSPRGAAAMPSGLDRLRMSPSPRARNRKKLVKKQASFKDLLSPKYSGGGTGAGAHINTIFETQEVLLHNACCLIRMLVLDHSKVRSFLIHDIDNHWPAVPEEELEINETEKKGKKSALFSRFFPRNNHQEKAKGDSKQSPPTAFADTHDNKINSKAENEEKTVGKGGGTGKEKGEEKSEGEPLVTRLKKNRKKASLVNLHEYGPPLYAHLNPSSWEMCLLARSAIEDSIELLDLDIQFYHSNKVDEEDEEGKEKGVKTEEREEKGAKALSGAINKSYQKTDENSNNNNISNNNTGGSKPPLNNAPPSYSGAGAGAGSISMTKKTQDGHRYDVTVPLLTLPKKVNDSFEKRLLSADENGNSNRSHFNSENSSRIASRFKRK